MENSQRHKQKWLRNTFKSVHHPSNYGNANQNNFDISFSLSQNGKNQQNNYLQILQGIQGNGSPHSLLMAFQKMQPLWNKYREVSKN